MAVTRRFLIVGWKVKTGGGEVILRNYLSFLNDNPDDCSYVALVHDKALYEPVACPRVRLVQPGRLLQTNLAAPWMYHVVLPRLLKAWRIDGIFVFGGIPIPTSVPQLYLFQWAYAVYPHSPAWRRMDLLSLINRRIRVWAFRRYIRYPSMVIAQTETMKRRLSTTCGVSRISTVPVAVSPQHSAQRETWPFDRPAGRVVFLCLTHYYPHKNLETLLPVAAQIKERSLAYTIVTTIEAEDHKRAAKLLTRLRDQGLTDIVTNIGRVRHADLAALYSQCDAMILPTLLESFSATYIEAMFHGKTILTSDLDFARDVCGEAAFYFDPLNPQSIVESMVCASQKDEIRERKLAAGRKRLSQLWTSGQVFGAYQELLRSL